MMAIGPERTFESRVDERYCFSLRGAGPLEERFEWCPPPKANLQIHLGVCIILSPVWFVLYLIVLVLGVKVMGLLSRIP